jgi:hypothetical protein
MSDADQERLDTKWQPFKTVVAEEEAIVISEDDRLSCVSRFCPEVAFLIFGFFASSLGRYGDEEDKALAHKRLQQQGAGLDDPGWTWETIHARHYTECSEYSLFATFASEKPKKGSGTRAGISPKDRWRIFARDSFTCQYCGRRPPDVALELDHRVAFANGGSDAPENLVTSCFDCNRGKGAENSV